MLGKKTIAVVVPAYNEASQILGVLESMPDFVDRIVVVNDASRDETEKIVLDFIGKARSRRKRAAPRKSVRPQSKYDRAEIVAVQIDEMEEQHYIPSSVLNTDPAHDRVILISQHRNGGVGAAIARGYKWCRDNRIDCTAVMAGDGQMDPAELRSICEPVVEEGVDYVKGNRLIHRSAWLVVPRIRYFGNSILSLLTKIASGYWRVSDTQTGYTAISLKALNAIRIHRIYRSYGMPNDMLVKLNIAYCTIKEIEIKPVYSVGETSKMKIWKVIPGISLLLLRSFFKRLWVKYLFRDFHPLFVLYHMTFFIFLCLIPLVWEFMRITITGEAYPVSLLILFTVLSISGFQSFIFAMWMDIMDNERLYR